MRKGETVFCDGCGVEVLWTPVRAGQQVYCCEDCRDGFECHCGPGMEDDEYPRGGGIEAYESVTGEMNLL